MNLKRAIVTTSFVTVFALSIVGFSFAEPVGLGGPGEILLDSTLHTVDVPQIPGEPTYHFEQPIPFFYDPFSPPLTKVLFPPVDATGQQTGWDPNQVYSLHEEFEFVPPPGSTNPGPALTDWHEEFWTDPGAFPPAEWIFGTISTDWPPQGVPPLPVPGLEVENHGHAIWFFFDPIPPGFPGGPPTILHIWKEFVVNPNHDPFQPIQIHEWPTVPEPTTFALAGLGVALLGFGGRRRRR